MTPKLQTSRKTDCLSSSLTIGTLNRIKPKIKSTFNMGTTENIIYPRIPILCTMRPAYPWVITSKVSWCNSKSFPSVLTVVGRHVFATAVMSDDEMGSSFRLLIPSPPPKRFGCSDFGCSIGTMQREPGAIRRWLGILLSLFSPSSPFIPAIEWKVVTNQFNCMVLVPRAGDGGEVLPSLLLSLVISLFSDVSERDKLLFASLSFSSFSLLLLLLLLISSLLLLSSLLLP